MSGGPSDIEAEFIAGFAQAEGHFGILEQNGGQSVACVFSLQLRDDDTALIAWLHDVTRLGAIHPVPAKRTSAPQSAWLIGRRAEVKSLARLLTLHPMYGRKAAEFEVWKRAVIAWNEDPPDRPTMRAAISEVLRRRRYTHNALPVHITVPPREQVRHYLGGFISGDGHFSMSGRPSMTLKQRRDELPLLRGLCCSVGLGNVYEDRSRPGNPAAMWVVSGTDACNALAQLLTGTIRGKKAAEFEIWANTLESMAGDRNGAASLVASADAALKELRGYRAPRGRLRRPPLPRVSAPQIIDALREFAAEHDGALQVGAYTAIRRERHPEWPNRNTVARHFGSWHAGLEAAGLADRAASRPDRFHDRSRAVFDARRSVQRERVLDSVRRFVAGAGHVPRAMEYFRWRLAHDPETPTQATVYKLFPGGWPAVLMALGVEEARAA